MRNFGDIEQPRSPITLEPEACPSFVGRAAKSGKLYPNPPKLSEAFDSVMSSDTRGPRPLQ